MRSPNRPTCRPSASCATPPGSNPDKGLVIFEKYLAFVQANPKTVPDAKHVIEDLRDVLRLIGEAKRLDTKWRLLLDT